MGDRGMNELLKWSIENSETPSSSTSTNPTGDHPPGRSINAEALNSLLGGPSDADLMKASMAAITSSNVSLADKLVAFDNFEQLVEQVDNANDIENLGLWPSLAALLSNEEADLRRYACWCIGTAVQNNVKCQERPKALGIIPQLINVAINDSEEQVRRKAIYAISSEVRNYQPGLDEAVQALPKGIVPEGGVDAANMDAVDQIMQKLRDESAKKALAR